MVDFAAAFHRKYPRVWEKNKQRWDKIFPEVKTSVEVEAHIIRPGNVSAPGGMPREDYRRWISFTRQALD
ncbi:Ger(x)C family spore germination C-terminal domain-containing protein [Paenibacillus antri]|uniref:Ger(x)C family spore germination C-terminal domain-containing protein n=1 Tax=Paenibacillus antri TaxID=2582848 RepID=UPI0034DE7689